MHYVCADIHGQYEKFKRMKEKINFGPDDKMYVLGDAIDRGSDPAKCLLDILTDSRITFLVGNHEDMMLEAFHNDDNGDAIDTWFMNGAEATINQSLEIGMTADDWNEAILEDAYLVIPDLVVNGKHFYLTHAAHLDYVVYKPVLYRTASAKDVRQAVWSREYRHQPGPSEAEKYMSLYTAYPETTMIFGHTPVTHCKYGKATTHGQPRISHFAHGHAINIDCGCAMGKTLGCLRLEDMREFYVD